MPETSIENANKWFDDYAEDERDDEVVDYDITATPNDFNVLTLFSFMEEGSVVIPGFQRHYVWDRRRASKLIESLILGLPVPQLFLYEEGKNRFLVIDGQQRLMSIYYFLKQRFPRGEARTRLKEIFNEHGRIPDEVLHDDDYFENFRLSLPSKLPGGQNELDRLSYATLGDHKTTLNLRPIRNVIVKQNSPSADNSSIYEIFSRLNSGGVNLTPQEIRLSLYHSEFYDMLHRINADPKWRRLIGSGKPDLHMKDIEVLLRMFAMLVDSDNYAPSMVKFLNQFSKKCESHNGEQNRLLRSLFHGFVEASSELRKTSFLSKRTGRFNIALIEAVFASACRAPFRDRRDPRGKLVDCEIESLGSDEEFREAASSATTQTSNVVKRLERGAALISSL